MKLFLFLKWKVLEDHNQTFESFDNAMCKNGERSVPIPDRHRTRL